MAGSSLGMGAAAGHLHACIRLYVTPGWAGVLTTTSATASAPRGLEASSHLRGAPSLSQLLSLGLGSAVWDRIRPRYVFVPRLLCQDPQACLRVGARLGLMGLGLDMPFMGSWLHV